MSKRTLPAIGSKNWGSTLNNYLRVQEGRQTEIENEISDLYSQSNNVVQTVLSSGVNMTTVHIEGSAEDKLPGLYLKGNNGYTKVESGTQIPQDTSNYWFIANVTIVAAQNIIDTIEINLPAFNLDGLSPYDAFYVYAKYSDNNENKDDKWSIEYRNETSLSLNPYNICLGTITKIDTTYYWNYKTMLPNIDISTKQWLLSEANASLTTYFNAKWEDDNTISFGPYADNLQESKLTVQALGINPVNEIDTVNSELYNNIKQFTIASWVNNNISYNFDILHNGTGITYTSYKGETSKPIISDLQPGNYRLLATSISIENNPLFILQKANNGSNMSLDHALFNDSDFSNILFIADAVELYRIKIDDAVTMVASPKNGISPINANGLNPHVSTLIKDDDNVRFGNSLEHYIHFINNNLQTSKNIYLPYPAMPGSILLTNNWDCTVGNTSNNNISLKANDITLGSKDFILNASNINLKPSNSLTIKYENNPSYKPFINFTTDPYIYFGITDNVHHKSNSIKMSMTDTNDSIFLQTDDFSMMCSEINANSHNIIFNSSEEINLKSNNIILSSDYKKSKIKFDLSRENDPRIYLGSSTGGGDETYLSPKGLYFPSSSKIDGIVIDNLTGSFQSITHTIIDIKEDTPLSWSNDTGDSSIYNTTITTGINFSTEWLNQDLQLTVTYYYNNSNNKYVKILPINTYNPDRKFINFIYNNYGTEYILITISWDDNNNYTLQLTVQGILKSINITTEIIPTLLKIKNNNSHIEVNNNINTALITMHDNQGKINIFNNKNGLVSVTNDKEGLISILNKYNQYSNLWCSRYVFTNKDNISSQDSLYKALTKNFTESQIQQYFWYYNPNTSITPVDITKIFSVEKTLKPNNSFIIYLPELKRYKLSIQLGYTTNTIDVNLSTIYSVYRKWGEAEIDLFNNDSILSNSAELSAYWGDRIIPFIYTITFEEGYFKLVIKPNEEIELGTNNYILIIVQLTDNSINDQNYYIRCLGQGE